MNDHATGGTQTAPVVETAAGRVRGAIIEGVAAFKCIPYGAPTSGVNRFMPPRKPEPWTSVRDAIAYAGRSPQAGAGTQRPELAGVWGPRDNLPVGQFYEISADMQDPYVICGGLQDNGHWCVPSATRNRNGIANRDAFNIGSGDGFYARIDPSDPRTVLLEKIERQTFRAAKIVNGLLNLSRPGPTGSDRTHTDLNAVITDVVSLLEHQFEVGSVKVRRDLSPAPVTVRGIEHQLQQVFLNLFLNARDAMPSGGWLSVTTRVEGGRAIAEVADTGSGIPPEQLSRIYDPFFTTKAIGRGTGLGLSITYGIVREHDGQIHVDSAVGQGTRFTVDLPLAAAAAAAPKTSSAGL